MDDKKNAVLIVDDNKSNIKLLISTLESHGFETITARSGAMGIRRAEFSGPDLILLDVMMPGMDGFETCRHLKANNKTKGWCCRNGDIQIFYSCNISMMSIIMSPLLQHYQQKISLSFS